MKIEVNIDKKYFVIILSLITIIGVVLVTNAFNPSMSGGNPAVMGHSADELYINFSGNLENIQQVFNQIDTNNDGIIDRIEMPDSLDVNSVTTDTIDIDQICINGDCRDAWPEPTAETTWLVNSQHTTQACSDNGGEIVSDGSGNNFCRFDLSSCPAGWIHYQDWRTQESNTQSGTLAFTSTLSCPGCTYYHGYATAHGAAWSNTPHHRCCEGYPLLPCTDYSADEQCGDGSVNHYSIVTQIGCY